MRTRLAEISQRIDASIDLIRSHFLRCHVRREIFIDNDLTTVSTASTTSGDETRRIRFVSGFIPPFVWGRGMTVDVEAGREAYYVLGRGAEEVERLQSQAAFIQPFTDRLFRDAGIAGGMKVLDLGSGAGDLALLAARLVGQEGAVLMHRYKSRDP
jgi:hypothetical protein